MKKFCLDFHQKWNKSAEWPSWMTFYVDVNVNYQMIRSFNGAAIYIKGHECWWLKHLCLNKKTVLPMPPVVLSANGTVFFTQMAGSVLFAAESLIRLFCRSSKSSSHIQCRFKRHLHSPQKGFWDITTWDILARNHFTWFKDHVESFSLLWPTV